MGAILVFVCLRPTDDSELRILIFLFFLSGTGIAWFIWTSTGGFPKSFLFFLLCNVSAIAIYTFIRGLVLSEGANRKLLSFLISLIYLIMVQFTELHLLHRWIEGFEFLFLLISALQIIEAVLASIRVKEK
jgi:hypothetical protein